MYFNFLYLSCILYLYQEYIFVYNDFNIIHPFITNVIYNSSIYYKCNYYRLIVFLKKLQDKSIISILDFDIPNYFLTKLDDMNIIIGQQQLESLDMVINILKNKNRLDKIETIKKSNIQKSVAWCDKYKIPCKQNEKVNIFTCETIN